MFISLEPTKFTKMKQICLQVFFSLKESKQTEQFKHPLYDSFIQFSSQDITFILAPKTWFLKVSFKLPIFFRQEQSYFSNNVFWNVVQNLLLVIYSLILSRREFFIDFERLWVLEPKQGLFQQYFVKRV